LELPSSSEGSQISSTIIATRKRSIGNVNYTEEIYKVTSSCDEEIRLPIGYRWVEWSEMKNITLSAPHRRWINELKNKDEKNQLQ